MAERRMFAKTIVFSDAFLDMPMSARCLYFTLGMFADDDGFVNSPKSIMRQCGASMDDMNILMAKKFIIIFESGIIVIKHWRIHNYIRQDTYSETKCVDEKGQLYLSPDKTYEMIPSTSRGRAVDGAWTQDRIGKDSIGKNNNNNNPVVEKKDNITLTYTDREVPTKGIRSLSEQLNAKKFMERFNSVEGVLPCSKLLVSREICIDTILNNFTEDEIDRAFENLEKSDFLRGKVVDKDGKKFNASFSWFINLEHFTRVLEGAYNGRQAEDEDDLRVTDLKPEDYLNQGGSL